MYFFLILNIFNQHKNKLKWKNSLNNSYPNVIITKSGKIICKPNYISSKFIDSKGCWICNNKCKKIEYCEFPGLCKNRTLEINGYSFRQNLFKNNELKILFKYSYNIDSSNFSPTKLFCRFDNITLPSIFVNNNDASCLIPSISFNYFYISFDAYNWSKPIQISKKSILFYFFYHIIGFIFSFLCLIVIFYNF